MLCYVNKLNPTLKTVKLMLMLKLTLTGNLGEVGPKLLRRRNSLGPTFPRLPLNLNLQKTFQKNFKK